MGTAPDCSAEFDDRRLMIAAGGIESHEGGCKLQGLSPGGPAPIEMQLYCQYEGEERVALERWTPRTVAGHRFLTIRSLVPYNPYEIVYGLCTARPARAEAPKPRGKGRSACWRSGRSEFKLTTYDDRTADFAILSAQGNAHICELNGTAQSQRDGYLYTEKLDSGGVCRLTIKFGQDDSVRFRDQDDACKQHHCGARASFENIRLGSRSRVACRR